ncbi:hypothetical protein V492_02627 [Pseudogymnoascus sp. VKM F-4246]|nr:hypothetical protein V492_02627 [Pseudogymnoascus sp. VKM F-4246]
MCPPTLPSSPPLADADTDSDHDSELPYTPSEPPYTPSELAAIVVDFYTFLTTLHFPASGLKLAPPGGWPNITPSSNRYLSFKSPLATEVMRQLPYFDKSTEAYAHYKSRFIDHPSLRSPYWTFSKGDDSEEEDKDEEEDEEEDEAEDEAEDEFFDMVGPIESADGEEVDPRDVVCLASGRESGGAGFFLDVRRGEITEDIARMTTLSPVDVVVFFERLKEEYRSLKLIPCTGYLVMIKEEEEVEESEGVSTEVMMRQIERWGTKTDVRWLRALYRRWGWPDRYQRVEAEREVNEAMSKMEEGQTGGSGE